MDSSVRWNLRARSCRELSSVSPMIEPFIVGSAMGDRFPYEWIHSQYIN